MDSLNVYSWNSSGWFGKNIEARFEMVQGLAADVAFICESWERKDHVPSVPGYVWLGNPRLHSNKKQRRGCGGVGFFIKQTIMIDYNVNVVDASCDGILALELKHKMSQ